jgi:hypothetical protein
MGQTNVEIVTVRRKDGYGYDGIIYVALPLIMIWERHDIVGIHLNQRSVESNSSTYFLPRKRFKLLLFDNR